MYEDVRPSSIPRYPMNHDMHFLAIASWLPSAEREVGSAPFCSLIIHTDHFTD